MSDRVNSQYQELLAASAGGERAFREKAWESYARLGLPSRKNENWKYTALNLGDWNFSREEKGSSVVLPRAASDLLAAWSKDFCLAVTVNGMLRSDMSDPLVKPLNFAEVKPSLEDGWSSLTSAVARAGFQLELNHVLNKPLLIVHAQTSGNAWSPSVNRVSLGQGARADVAEVYLGIDQPYLRTNLTSMVLGTDAVLNWLSVQDESREASHFAETQVSLSSHAQLNFTQLHGGSQWSRASLCAAITGEGSAAHLSGLTFARMNQHIDQRVEVRHLKGQSESSQLFKGVLKDQSRGVLNGKIYIAKDAQKVSSRQLNHNLLLGAGAEADTKPELEIYADDVKANHGASVGRLDEDKVFYLMSRGIPRAQAQQMLAHAFAGDVLMKIGNGELRRLAEDRVRAWLPNFSVDLEQSMIGGDA